MATTKRPSTDVFNQQPKWGQSNSLAPMTPFQPQVTNIQKAQTPQPTQIAEKKCVLGNKLNLLGIAMIAGGSLLVITGVIMIITYVRRKKIAKEEKAKIKKIDYDESDKPKSEKTKSKEKPKVTKSEKEKQVDKPDNEEDNLPNALQVAKQLSPKKEDDDEDRLTPKTPVSGADDDNEEPADVSDDEDEKEEEPVSDNDDDKSETDETDETDDDGLPDATQTAAMLGKGGDVTVEAEAEE